MNVQLRDIDTTNFKAVIELKVEPGQQNFVAPNVVSIAQCHVAPHLTPKAVYAGEDLVGFALFGRDRETGQYWIARLMIDAANQGKGYGRAAVTRLLDDLGRLPDCSEIFLSFAPDNHGARKLYESVGFAPTGDIDEGEIVMRYEVGGQTGSAA